MSETGPAELPVNPLTEKQRALLDNNFRYHKPIGLQPARYALMRDNARLLAEFIMRNTPQSREQSVALTKLEEVMFWANAAIARNEGAPPETAPAR